MKHLIVHRAVTGTDIYGKPRTIRRGVYQILPPTSDTPDEHVAVQVGDTWVTVATTGNRAEVADQLLVAQRIRGYWNVFGHPAEPFHVDSRLLGRLDKAAVTATMSRSGHRVGRWVPDPGHLASAPVLAASLTLGRESCTSEGLSETYRPKETAR